MYNLRSRIPRRVRVLSMGQVVSTPVPVRVERHAVQADQCPKDTVDASVDEPELFVGTDVLEALASSSQTSGEPEPETQDQATCNICLDVVTNKSVLEPCMHSFCFSCIDRWSAVKDTCPTCRTVATKLLHDIRSDGQHKFKLIASSSSSYSSSRTMARSQLESQMNALADDIDRILRDIRDFQETID
ncbi:E3 ubiquitin-protein ligase ICP0 [Halotydeus destructor]|nr:E3 ubiquitin-protein ligase ICP0 [Halotydeus destructor]